MEQSVRLQRFGPVGDVVLVAQLVGDVFERLLQVFHLEGEECLAPGLRRQVLQHLIAVAFDLADVGGDAVDRSEEHTSELQSLRHLVCRLLLEKKNNTTPSLEPLLSEPTTLSTSPARHAPRQAREE